MQKTILLSLLLSLTVLSCITESDLSFENSISIDRNDSLNVSLKLNEIVKINDEFEISFLGVEKDSRCPIDVICVWAGDAEVILELKSKSLNKKFILHSFLTPQSIVFNQYEIYLTKVLPLRKQNIDIQQKDYSIELKIINNVNQEKRKIYLINNELNWLISNDYLKINSIEFENKMLNASLSYSGGCREHYINLFSDNAIMKSNPPQVNFYFSHNANDDLCEAYITKKIIFDMSEFNKLIKGYNVVLINIYSPNGKLVEGSPFYYKNN